MLAWYKRQRERARIRAEAEEVIYQAYRYNREWGDTTPEYWCTLHGKDTVLAFEARYQRELKEEADHDINGRLW